MVLRLGHRKISQISKGPLNVARSPDGIPGPRSARGSAVLEPPDQSLQLRRDDARLDNCVAQALGVRH